MSRAGTSLAQLLDGGTGWITRVIVHIHGGVHQPAAEELVLDARRE